MQGKTSTKYEIDMCNGPILKKMLTFALPLMCSSILQLLFNAVDVIMVGKFAGDESLAAVGSTTSLINLLVNFFIGLSIGVNVLVSKYCAAKREKQVKETVHTAILVAAISGIILSIIGITLAPIILKIMDTPKEILGLATVYVRTYFLGTIATILYNFGAAILRAVGDTKRPMSYLIVAGLVNVVFNLFFVIVFKWGVFGVGIATAISHIISAVLVLRCLVRTEGMIRLDIKELRLYKDKFFKILRVGLPAGIQSSLFNIANVTIQSSVNLFGATVVAGNSAATNIGGFIHAAQDSFSQASLTFTSQNVGAGKHERIGKVLRTALGCVTVTGMIVGWGAYLIGPQLLSFYTNSSVVVDAGMAKLSFTATTYLFCGIMGVLVGSLRGMGYSVLPVINSFVGTCVLRILWLQTIFRMPQFHTIQMVYIVFPLSWILTSLVHLISYFVVRQSKKKETRLIS